jgi:hypothetical protein
MLSFEEKKAIFQSFKLKEKEISNGRVSFVYPESKQRGQVLATQLHPSGNGYVVGKYMSEETIKKNGYLVDPRGWISIRDFSKEEMKTVIREAAMSMSGVEIEPETKSKPELELKPEAEAKPEAQLEPETKVEPEHLANSEPPMVKDIPEKAEKKAAPNETFKASSASEKIGLNCLNNWMELTKAVTELNYLVWRGFFKRLSR